MNKELIVKIKEELNYLRNYKIPDDVLQLIDSVDVNDDSNYRKISDSICMKIDMRLSKFIDNIRFIKNYRKDYLSRDRLKKLFLLFKLTDILHVDDMTDKIIKKYRIMLQYMRDQTEEICLEAVRQDGNALRFVIDQTEEICLAAVRQDGGALQYVIDQTEEICLEAVRQNGVALKYVRDQTEEICLAAVRQNSDALKYVREITTNILIESFSKGYMYLNDIFNMYDIELLKDLKTKDEILLEDILEEIDLMKFSMGVNVQLPIEDKIHKYLQGAV